MHRVVNVQLNNSFERQVLQIKCLWMVESLPKDDGFYRF